ncbi:MAG: hypothetical protein IT424_06725 [Pirellulales bacterium]|nr:hypothetical protein [Pirellulales bacterium]
MSSGSPNDGDADEELELEPIDPEVLAHAQARAEARTEQVAKNLKIDPLDQKHPGGYSDVELDPSSWLRFRFTTQHLLIATALLALTLTMFELLPPGLAWLLLGFACVAAGFLWVYRIESRDTAQRHPRRTAFETPGEDIEHVAAVARAGADADSVRPRFEFNVAFSLKQAFVTMTAAAVAVGATRILGGPGLSAVMLGSVALIGLAVHAAGYDPPPAVVLAWWLLLVAYLLIGAIALMAADSATPPAAAAIRKGHYARAA